MAAFIHRQEPGAGDTGAVFPQDPVDPGLVPGGLPEVFPEEIAVFDDGHRQKFIR